MNSEILELLQEAIAIENQIISLVEGDLGDLYGQFWQIAQKIRVKLFNHADRGFWLRTFDAACQDKTIREFEAFYRAYLKLVGDTLPPA